MGAAKDKAIGMGIFGLCLGLMFFRALFSDSQIQSNLTLEQSKTMFQELGGAAEAKPVTVFMTSWCPTCRALEGDLARAGIPFIQVDVEKNQTAMLYYQRITQGQSSGVPLTVVGPSAVLGLDLAAIAKAYKSL